MPDPISNGGEQSHESQESSGWLKGLFSAAARRFRKSVTEADDVQSPSPNELEESPAQELSLEDQENRQRFFMKIFDRFELEETVLNEYSFRIGVRQRLANVLSHQEKWSEVFELSTQAIEMRDEVQRRNRFEFASLLYLNCYSLHLLRENEGEILSDLEVKMSCEHLREALQVFQEPELRDKISEYGNLLNGCLSMLSFYSEDDITLREEMLDVVSFVCGPDSVELGRLKFQLGGAYLKKKNGEGSVRRAQKHLEEAKLILEAIPYSQPVAYGACLGLLGQCHERSGDLETSERFFRESAVFARTCEGYDFGDRAAILRVFADFLVSQEAFAEASQVYCECLEFYLKAGDRLKPIRLDLMRRLQENPKLLQYLWD